MAAERENREENDLIQFIANDKYHSADHLIYNVLDNPDKELLLRSNTRSSTKGCKYWQLILAILVLIQNFYKIPNLITTILRNGISLNNKDIYDRLSELVHKIYKQIMSNKRSAFDSFFVNNNGDTLVEECDNIDKLQEGVNFLCLYDINKNKNKKHISHYFSVIKIADKYYCTSSYGSDFVTVPYYTLKLDIKDFDALIQAYKNNNIEIIKYFYNKYFFKGNIPIIITNDLLNENPLLENLKIGSKLKTGPNVEFKYVHKNMDSTSFHIGIVPSYYDNINPDVDIILNSQNTNVRKAIELLLKNRNSIKKSPQTEIKIKLRQSTRKEKALPYNRPKGGRYKRKTLKKMRKQKK